MICIEKNMIGFCLISGQFVLFGYNKLYYFTLDGIVLVEFKSKRRPIFSTQFTVNIPLFTYTLPVIADSSTLLPVEKALGAVRNILL